MNFPLDELEVRSIDINPNILHILACILWLLGLIDSFKYRFKFDCSLVDINSNLLFFTLTLLIPFYVNNSITLSLLLSSRGFSPNPIQ